MRTPNPLPLLSFRRLRPRETTNRAGISTALETPAARMPTLLASGIDSSATGAPLEYGGPSHPLERNQSLQTQPLGARQRMPCAFAGNRAKAGRHDQDKPAALRWLLLRPYSSPRLRLGSPDRYSGFVWLQMKR